MAYIQTHFKAWSYTRYADHKQCPYFAQQKHLAKVQFPKSAAMERGARIAAGSEAYLKKQTNKLIPELKSFKDEYAFYRAQKNLIVEENWGFTKDWKPCAWDDWNNCTLRVKIDVGYICVEDNELHIRDGKSGKFYEDGAVKYMEQLELYTAAGIAMFPQVKWVVPRLNYTDLGITYPDGEKVPDIIVAAKDAAKLQSVWDKRIKPLMADRKFAPRPGRYCQWCPLSKSKGGTCKY